MNRKEFLSRSIVTGGALGLGLGTTSAAAASPGALSPSTHAQTDAGITSPIAANRSEPGVADQHSSPQRPRRAVVQAGGPTINVHLAPDGHDRGEGTKRDPLVSLAGARDLLRELRAAGLVDRPTRVIAAGGTYFFYKPVVFEPHDSGSEQAPVVFTSRPDNRATFVGGLPVGGWQPDVVNGVACYKTHIPQVARYGLHFEQLYVNGKRATRARFPKQGFYRVTQVEEQIIERGEGRIPTFAAQRIGLPDEAAARVAGLADEELRQTLFMFYHKWDNTRKRPQAFLPETAQIVTTGTGMKPWNVLNSRTRFTMENLKGALQAPGEWFLQSDGTLYYIPRPDEDMTQATVYAPLSEQFIIINGSSAPGGTVSHLRFEHLVFQAGAYTTPPEGNESSQAANGIDAAVRADFAQHIHFYNCEISQTGNYGMWFREGCSDCSVRRCYLHDLGAGGIKLGSNVKPALEDETSLLTRRIIVDNCIIRSGGYVFPCAVGVILFHTADNQVTHNEIAHFRYTGVSVGWVWGYDHSAAKGNTIAFNHIHHLGWGELDDMGAVYCLGRSEGTRVVNNHIHHVYSFDYGGWGLYTDEGATGILMENNLVYGCKEGSFHQHFGRENRVQNNILGGGIRYQLQGTRREDHLSFWFTRNIVWFNRGTLLGINWHQMRMESDRNCYWDTRTTDLRFHTMTFSEWQALGHDAHSIVADPHFTDAVNADYRFVDERVPRQIGFKPFDYTRAGVYGDSGWMNLARTDPELERAFEALVQAGES